MKVSKLSGPLCAIACCVAQGLTALQYFWGNLRLYLQSYHAQYFRDQDDSIYDWLFVIMFLFELLTVAAASNIQKAIGMKPALVLSIASFIAGLLLSASTLNIYISCIGFATLVGFGSGLVLILTIWPVWSYYPNHKDIVTGALTGSYALGNAGFSILVTVLANPMGELIDERGLYSDNVNQNYIYCMVWLCSIILVLGAVILFGVSINPNASKEETASSNAQENMYSNWRFWGIFLIAFLWGNFINFVNNVYKVMGSVYIKNDAILSLAGSIGIALGIVGKLGWPVLSKYLSFKVTAQIVNLSALACYVITPFTLHNAVFFSVITVISFFVMSSATPLELLYCGETFGGELGPVAFGKIYFATGISTISQVFVEKLGKAYGFEYSCIVMSIFFVIGTVIIQTLPAKQTFKSSLKTSMI